MAYAPERHNVEPPEFYAIFPFRLPCLGLLDENTASYTFEKRSEECHLLKPFAIGNTPKMPSYCGWQDIGVVAALLGMDRLCGEILSYNCSLYNPGYRFPAMWGPVYDAVPDVDHGANIVNLLHHMVYRKTEKGVTILPAFPGEWEVEYRLYLDRNTILEGKGKDYRVIRITA